MISQIAIFVLGPLAVLLANDARPLWRRWAPVVGLLSQPFWFYATYCAHQWGIFAVAFLYTAAWARGFYYGWIKK